MSFIEAKNALDEALPDSKVEHDVRFVLRTYAGDGEAKIKLRRRKISIPAEATVDVVTKAFFKEYFEQVGFGVYKVLVALGGFELEEHGFHKARYCFMTLFYNEDGEMITEDFHLEFR